MHTEKTQDIVAQVADSPMAGWIDVCSLSDIAPGTAVAALIGEEQVAIARPSPGSQVYALGNFDPFSKAFVMARGILGDRGGIPKIASPIYKQNFDLRTGQCLDDANVFLPVHACRVVNERILVALGATRADPGPRTLTGGTP